MIRRPLTLLAAGLLALSMLAAPAAADEDEPPLHGHMLIQRPTVDWLTVEDDGVPWDGPYVLAIRRCIDLPVTPLQGHHANVHEGRAAEGLANAGHAVAPVAPLTPYADCAAFETALAEAGALPAGPPPEPPSDD